MYILGNPRQGPAGENRTSFKLTEMMFNRLRAYRLNAATPECGLTAGK